MDLESRICYTIHRVKTKILISYLVFAQLICKFVLHVQKIRLSHEVAHILSHRKVTWIYRFLLLKHSNRSARPIDFS